MCVRPIFTILAHAEHLSTMAFRRAVTAGSRRRVTWTAAAMFIAVGKVSFEDFDMLTWPLGCTGVLLPSGVPAS